MAKGGYPVHSSIDVHAGETIYRTDDWWKAAVTHSYDSGEPEIAIYLWHKDDDGWTRKNKYHVKTAEAWKSDRQLVDEYLSGGGKEVDAQDDFPVSDYYHVARGESIFKADDWWKAIVTIDQKGSYETQEVIIYLWQQVDGDWRRRQKYAIKDVDDWQDDQTAVDALLDEDVEPTEPEVTSAARTDSVNEQGASSVDASGEDILDNVQAEFKELHLGSGVEEEV